MGVGIFGSIAAAKVKAANLSFDNLHNHAHSLVN